MGNKERRDIGRGEMDSVLDPEQQLAVVRVAEK